MTSMEIELYPITELYAGNLFYPAEMARVVLRRWRRDSDLTSAIGTFSNL